MTAAVSRFDVVTQPRLVAMRRQVQQTYATLRALEGPLGGLLPHEGVRDADARSRREAVEALRARWRDETAAYERAVAEAVEALRRERAAEA